MALTRACRGPPKNGATGADEAVAFQSVTLLAWAQAGANHDRDEQGTAQGMPLVGTLEVGDAHGVGSGGCGADQALPHNGNRGYSSGVRRLQAPRCD